MDTYVAAAVDLPPPGDGFEVAPEIRTAALPSGFPFLVDADTGQVVEAALLFLVQRHLEVSRRWVVNTALAHAHDLNDWWKYLGARGLAWDEVGRADLLDYKRAMEATISLATHGPLSLSSRRRRLGTVLAMYAWARRKKLFTGDFDDVELRHVRRSLDSDPLAHIGSRPEVVTVSDLMPRDNSGPDDKVRPLTGRDARLVMRELGPLPSENIPGVPCRDRLAGETALNTGARVDEIAKMPVHRVLALLPSDPDDARAVVPLRLTETKGMVPRTVLVPTWLLRELVAYIEGERKQALERARELGLPAGARTLFVNGIEARAHVGRPIRRATLQDAFRRAVVAAGLIVRVPKVNPENGELYLKAVPKHSFHDLRHTFAVWTYQARHMMGDPTPWKYVQARLGHKTVAITMAFYVRVVDELEATASDYMASFYREMGRGEV
ncbi:tyrosine-type recombinase/integrase [Roseicella aerolata]|uniref:Site-specific integrase n=1 Tax=Roseicella aerolata TaxID=2883479 RepID=A0A9X1IGN7_9PROT|nr:site-specific integrase [Roseicella aerolata]